MRAECIDAVQLAVGRALTREELKDIEDRVRGALPTARRILMKEGQVVNKSNMLAKAGELASAQIKSEADNLRQRVALSGKARDRMQGFVDRAERGGRSAFEGIGDAIATADTFIQGIGQQYFTQMLATIRAAEPRFFGMLENPSAVRDLVFEMYGRDTGNATAKAGAVAWKQTTDAMRQRFNAAGGRIRQLLDWSLPQPHDIERVRTAGLEQWVRDVMPLVDRNRYVQPDGRLMNDLELSEVLAGVWRTIESNGLNNLEPGTLRMPKARANLHAESRQVHFQGPEAYLTYHASYGRGNVHDALQSHVHMLARDIGLVEEFGPNPDHLVAYFQDVAAKEGGKDRIWHGILPVTTGQLWANLSGRVNQVGEYAKLGQIAQGLRNLEVAGKLGSAFLSSFSDVGTFLMTLHYNRLPVFDGLRNFVRSLGADSMEYANRSGLIAESVISDMNRWGENNIGRGATSRLANATMKASLLSAWTDAIRRAFSLTMMGGMGKLTRLEWSALNAGDRARMAAKGITEADWGIYRMADLEDWRGSRMLTPESIKAIPGNKLAEAGISQLDVDRSISRLLGMIVDESQYASVAQDIYTRAQLNQGLQKGTIEGEISRSVALFKGYPFAMVSRHLMRALKADETGYSRVGYAASLGLSLTLFGALSLQAKDMKSGKDPRDMTDSRFWFQAFVQGGGSSIFGDLLYAGLTGGGRGGQSGATVLASSLAGPVFGDIFELVGDLGLENARQAKEGKDTHIGAEAVRYGLSHAPLINVWYARTVLDHAFLHEAQEFLSPGYLNKMQERVYHDYGQDFYWQPGQALPKRAPALEAMAGR